jgi:hypothetical protein
MSATITWHVTELGVENRLVDGHDDMISVVYWQCVGSEEVNGTTHVATLCRNTVIPYDATHHYVLYADLTEAEALEWVFEQDSIKANTEAEIQAMIDAQATPPILTPALPWAV